MASQDQCWIYDPANVRCNICNTPYDSGSAAAINQEPINEEQFQADATVKPSDNQLLIANSHDLTSSTPATGCGVPHHSITIPRIKPMRNLEPQKPIFLLSFAASKSYLSKPWKKFIKNFYQHHNNWIHPYNSCELKSSAKNLVHWASRQSWFHQVWAYDFHPPTSTTAKGGNKRNTWLTPLLSAYHFNQQTSNWQMLEMSKISTSKLFVFLVTNITTFYNEHDEQEIKCPSQPQVIVAKGAHPTSVMFNLILVFSNKFCQWSRESIVQHSDEGSNTSRAIANLIPPSSAFEEFFTQRSKRHWSKTIIIIIDAPLSGMGLKNLLAQVNDDIHK